MLGAIYFNKKLIAVDQGLVPEDFPSMRSRYRFTLAHELGHWRLHRHLYLRRKNQLSLLPVAADRPDHVLRSHQSDPKEIQANRFAACLLMPREMVKRVWHQWHGSMDPIYLDDLRAAAGDGAGDDALLDRACRPVAEKFQVSAESMGIRLEQLGFLMRKKEATLF